MKVLVVDDDYAVLDAIKDVLEDEGYEVCLAANGLEALKELRRGGPPCVILLDLMMPVMNGWQFLEQRRVHRELDAIPVVVMSAVGQRDRLPRLPLIKKPIELAILLQIVREHCCGERGPAPRSRDGEPVEPAG